MAEQDERSDLFDEEPGDEEQPLGERSSEGDGAPWAAGVTRRRFLATAGGAAAAGGVIGVAGGIGIASLFEDDEGTADAVVATTDGSAAPVGGGDAVTGVMGVPDNVPLPEAVVTLNVNGRDYRVNVTANMSLLEALRQRLGLTGSKLGCDRSECSACTVIVDGVSMNSCSLLAIREQGKQIVTIEGLERDGVLSPVQEGFVQHMGLQCGFCTPGQIMQATALLQQNPTPDEAEVRRTMSGNLCKCSAYPNIMSAIRYASEHWNA